MSLVFHRAIPHPASEGRGPQVMWVKTVRQAKRLIKIVFGFTLLLAGIVMLFTPGPGWPTIFAGLAVLATAEIIWARRLLDHLKARGVQLKDAVFSSNKAKASQPSGKES